MSWHRACHIEDVVSAGGKEVVVNGRVLAIFQSEGQLFATDGMCAHQGGPLAAGTLDGDCITCPWHGWQYDVSSGCNLLTKKKMIDTFAVEQREDEVWVELLE